MKRDLRALCLTVVLLQACSTGKITSPPGFGASRPNVGGGATPIGPAMAGGGTFLPGGAAGNGAVPGLPVAGGAPMGATMMPPPGVPGMPGMPMIPVVSEMPPGSGPDPDNWPGFGGGFEQTYARPNAMLDAATLPMLGSAWDEPAPGGVTGTPAVYNGVVYWVDWVGNVYAVKLDGTEVWKTKFDRGATSSLFVDEQRVYMSDRDFTVRAIDRLTGKEVWKTAISDKKLAQLWSSPTVADGVVVVGLGGKGTSNGGVQFAPADLMAFRGAVLGLNAEDGKIIWRFENTKGPDGMMYGPGVSSWSSAAIDTKRGVAYIGTGNSYYSPASPYSDSLLALNYKTTNPEGELVWSKQFTMNDNFTSGNPQGPDYDVGATPNLFTLDGKDYVSVGDKGGGFYVLDREKGELAYPRIRVSAGSSTGGVMAPAAYGDGTLYVTANNGGPTAITAINAKDGKILWTVSEPSGVTYGAPLLLKDVLLIGPTAGFPTGAPRQGRILALKRDTGMKLMWDLPIKNQRGGGLSVYKSMLFVTYGFVFENDRAESNLSGGVMAAAIGGTPLMEGEEMTATFAPTFTAIYNEILVEKGCSADRCHGGLGISLPDQASAYTNLLNAAPTADPACASKKFIVPNNVADSYLYTKLLPSPPCGGQMPLSLMPLTDQELTQIRTWIEMGAPNN